MIKPKHFLSAGALLLTLSISCQQQAKDAAHQSAQEEPQTTSKNTDSPSQQQESATAQDTLEASFNTEAYGLSEEDLGAFPYIALPQSYHNLKEHDKEFEEKYFFYAKGELEAVAGQYYHAQILADQDIEFSESFLKRYYDQAIKKLGASEIYTGYVPFKVTSRITTEQPSYIKDMYDYQSTHYKQYFLKTAQENIWFEINYGSNAPLIDFTVVRQKTVE